MAKEVCPFCSHYADHHNYSKAAPYAYAVFCSDCHDSWCGVLV